MTETDRRRRRSRPRRPLCPPKLVAGLTGLPYGRDNEDSRCQRQPDARPAGHHGVPEVHVAAFTNPEVYAYEAIKLAAGANVLGFGGAIGKKFNARLIRVGLDRLTIGLGKASASVSLSSGVPNAHVFMFATAPGGPRRISGWTVGHQQIFHPRPNDHALATLARQPGPSAVITVPFDLLDAHGSGVAGLDPQRPVA